MSPDSAISDVPGRPVLGVPVYLDGSIVGTVTGVDEDQPLAGDGLWCVCLNCPGSSILVRETEECWVFIFRRDISNEQYVRLAAAEATRPEFRNSPKVSEPVVEDGEPDYEEGEYVYREKKARRKNRSEALAARIATALANMKANDAKAGGTEGEGVAPEGKEKKSKKKSEPKPTKAAVVTPQQTLFPDW